MVEILLEAQGARPNFRYDILQPLLQGRATIEGATLRTSGPADLAGFFDQPRFKAGDFGLLDINMGDVVPAIDAGWDMRCLPVFIKRKPVYNYLWVRADRGIDTPTRPRGQDARDCRLQQLDLGLYARLPAALLRRGPVQIALAGEFTRAVRRSTIQPFAIDIASWSAQELGTAPAGWRSRRQHRRYHRPGGLESARSQPRRQAPVCRLPGRKYQAAQRARNLHARAHHRHWRQAGSRAASTGAPGPRRVRTLAPDRLRRRAVRRNELLAQNGNARAVSATKSASSARSTSTASQKTAPSSICFSTTATNKA